MNIVDANTKNFLQIAMRATGVAALRSIIHSPPALLCIPQGVCVKRVRDGLTLQLHFPGCPGLSHGEAVVGDWSWRRKKQGLPLARAVSELPAPAS